jgi:hypothetical protein
MNKHISRRTIQVTLGCFWLLDGFLQLQRQMFTKNFALKIIAPNEVSQPTIIHNPIHLAVHIILLHPALWDCAFAAIQFLIGYLLLRQTTVRQGLILSTIWGLSVWFIGEGLGGLFSGSASLIMGMPGAALLYVILGIGAWPHRHKDKTQPASWLTAVWATVWLTGASLQLTAGQNSAPALAAMIKGMARGAPGWLAALDDGVSRHIIELGSAVIIWLVFIEALIGILIFLGHFWRTLAVIAGIIFITLAWVIGQALGEYYTGFATDLNTAPFIILLGLAVLGSRGMTIDIT